MKIEIKNLYCPSWNDIQKLHYRKRNEEMQVIKSLVCAETRKAFEPRGIFATRVDPPVRITIEAHFKGGNRRDPDNLYVKPIIDGMVAAKVIPDDNGEVVESVTLRTCIRQPSDVIVIEIEEI